MGDHRRCTSQSLRTTCNLATITTTAARHLVHQKEEKTEEKRKEGGDKEISRREGGGERGEIRSENKKKGKGTDQPRHSRCTASTPTKYQTKHHHRPQSLLQTGHGRRHTNSSTASLGRSCGTTSVHRRWRWIPRVVPATSNESLPHLYTYT